MTEKDFEIVCSKIEEEKYFLKTVSHEIWKMPELRFKEVQAHALLTCALRRHGFKVQKHYFMPTAFRAEFCSKKACGATVAVLLEYDALPEIGHACGHNLIAEAGLAAAIGIKAAMQADETLNGKLVVLGTPAEEGGGGKIRLLELEAFDGVDIALMVHPASKTVYFPFIICNIRYKVEFKGREAHAASCPWEGRNALDAAVACYQNIASLRQHIKPTCKIQAIITKGGTAANIIPAESSMDVHLRAATKGELKGLQTRLEACFTSAAAVTGCDVQFRCDDANLYENLITNKILGTLFKEYTERLGLDKYSVMEITGQPLGSTDMGNVSHKVPAIQPLYAIKADGINHSKAFAAAAGAESAQEPTLIVSKAMALTALQVMRCSKTLEEVKRHFEADIADDMQS